MILEACEKLAVIKLGETPGLEFAVPLGEAADGYRDARDDYGAMHYDGEKLVLVGARGFYDDRALAVLVLDRTGPLYWGEYTCSIFACNDPGASPYISNWEKPIVIQ